MNSFLKKLTVALQMVTLLASFLAAVCLLLFSAGAAFLYPSWGIPLLLFVLVSYLIIAQYIDEA